MSDLELRQAYKRFNLPPDADQEEIRRAYLQLRQELDGEELRLLYSAWENLWSPQNRVRVDALLFQAGQQPPSLTEIQAEATPLADKVDWQSLIERNALVKQEAAAVTSLILERTWLGHAYSTLFGRPAPVAEIPTLPQVTLTPITQAIRPSVNEAARPTDVRPQRVSSYRPLWAAAMIGLLVFSFVMLRDSLPASLTAMSLSPRNTATASPAPAVAFYAAPSMAYVVPTLTPMGHRSMLVAQSSQMTPPPAMTVPIDSVALIDDLRERIKRNTELVENNEPDFAQSIFFGAVQPAPRLAIAPRTLFDSALATPSASQSLSITLAPPVTSSPPVPPPPTATTPPEPTASPTPQPVTMQSRTYTNVRSGPGVEYDVVEIIEPDAVRAVLVRTEDGAWLRIQTTRGDEGWVASLVVDVIGLMQEIEVQTD